MSVVIRTDRLVLRALDVESARAVLRGKAPDDVGWAHGYPLPLTIEAATLLLEQDPGAPRSDPFVSFQVIRRVDGLVVGDCGFGAPPDSAGIVEIRYELVRQSRPRGLESEALEALIGFAFTRDEVESVRAWVDADDAAGRRTLERAGMMGVEERDGRVCLEA